jgi:hypothetical protein
MMTLGLIRFYDESLAVKWTRSIHILWECVEGCGCDTSIRLGRPCHKSVSMHIYKIM